jgi:hypothetical protein
MTASGVSGNNVDNGPLRTPTQLPDAPLGCDSEAGQDRSQAGRSLGPVDQLFPVLEPIQHALRLGPDELEVLLVVGGRRRAGRREFPHPPERLLVGRQEFQVDVHPSQGIAEGDRLVDH